MSTLMGPEGVILRELSQEEKDNYGKISIIYGVICKENKKMLNER